MQWEVKVHSILVSFGFKQSDSDYEDAAQILRIKIIQAHRKYDPTRGEAIFHTYLHVAMRNATQDFIAVRRKASSNGKNISIDALTSSRSNSELSPQQGAERAVLGRLGVFDEYFPCPVVLTGAEAVLYNLLMMEMSYKDIYEICTGDVKKTRKSLERKIKTLKTPK